MTRSGTESEFYPQRLRLPQGWPAAAFLFFWGLGFGSAVLMAPLPIGLIFGTLGWGAAAAALYGGGRWLSEQRRGVRLDAEGVKELYWLREAKVLPWSSIRSVSVHGGRAMIDAEQGQVHLDGEIHGWRRLADRVESILMGAPADAEGQVDLEAEEVARWLGIDMDGALVSRPGGGNLVTALLLVPVWLLVTGLLAAFYFPFVRGALGESGRQALGMLMFTLAHASIFFGVFSGGLLLTILRRLRKAFASGLRVDVTGIRVRHAAGWRHFGWHELRDVVHRDGRWQIITNEEPIPLDPGGRHTARIVQAVRNAVEAREMGFRLPRLGEVPRGAISLAGEDTTPSVDRGLSRGDG